MNTQMEISCPQEEQQPNKKISFKSKVERFFDNNYAIFFAAFIVLAMYVAQLISSGVYPFGDGYTVASYDLSAQICPFIEHLFDVIDGKSTLTYSHAIAAGADVTGSILYFFVSPFSFLFLIFGDGKVAYAAGIVMAAKLTAAAVSGTWFVKKLFKNIPDYLCVAMGVVYTYCGYLFVANTYINWVDFIIYMPFCIAAFKHFVDTGKFLPFSILVACCIYTCFSIASFSLFMVFPALIAYGIFCVEKAKRNRFIAHLCLSFVVAVLIALPILLPALFAFVRSARGGGLFEEIWYGYELIDGKLVPKKGDYAFFPVYSTTVYKKWSYILSDSIFFILTLIWLYRSDWKKPFPKFMLAAGVLIFLPTIVDESMLLLNMGSYMQYSLRFGFLNAIYLFGGACLCLQEFCYKPGCAFDGAPLAETVVESTNDGGMSESKREKSTQKTDDRKTYAIILSVLGAAVVAFLLFFILDNNYKDEDFWGLLFKDSSRWSDVKGFSAAFAHTYGGVEVIIIFLISVALVFGVGALFVYHRKITCRFLSFVLILVVGVQVLFYNNQLVVGNLSKQHLDLKGYQTLANQVNAMDDSFFRVKDFGKVNSEDERSDVWTVNVPFTGNTNAYSVFSSVIDADNFAARNLFGYLGNDKNSIKSTHDTHGKYNFAPAFGDSFMGYKYFFVLKNQCDEVEKNAYVEKVMVENEKGELVHLQTKTDNGKEIFVYENKIVFPNGYRIGSTEGTFRFVSEITNGSTRKKNLAALYEFLRGENLKDFTGKSEVDEKVATELSQYLHERKAEVQVSAGKIYAKTTQDTVAGERLFLNFVASKGYEVTVNGKKATLVDNDLNFLCVELEDGVNEVEFTYTSPYPKYALLGLAAAVIGLCAVAFVLTKTKIVDAIAPVISWAGIVLAIGLVAFFMVYPTSIWIVKMVKYLI